MNAISQIHIDRGALLQIMDDGGAPQDRARNVARQLDAMLSAGEFNRLNSHQLVALRGVVWALAGIADDVEAQAQERQPVRAVRWWRKWL